MVTYLWWFYPIQLLSTVVPVSSMIIYVLPNSFSYFILSLLYYMYYSHYDNSASFSDFTSFGGWTSPSIKQYQGTTTQCSVGIDQNFY